MIWFDHTKARATRHKSGLMRVSARLAEELGEEARLAPWSEVQRRASARDWFVTAELFSEQERPGFRAFIEAGRCRTAAIFHDAIPLRHPEISWPQSVARHPDYMKLLHRFDRVWAVSEASARDLREYWQWLGVSPVPEVSPLALGSDFNREPRAASAGPAPAPVLLSVGIIEPRKNQALVLEACAALWRAGLSFELHFVGRVNPHFGKPIVRAIKQARREFRGLHFHEAADDRLLAKLYRTARATLFPTVAEGCGLPLLESLWRGVPCLCSDLPVLRENAGAGGCESVAVNDQAAWVQAIRRILTDDTHWRSLAHGATTRSLPTWAETARSLRAGLAEA